MASSTNTTNQPAASSPLVARTVPAAPAAPAASAAPAATIAAPAAPVTTLGNGVIQIENANNFTISIDNELNRIILRPNMITRNDDIQYSDVANSSIIRAAINNQTQEVQTYNYRQLLVCLIDKIRNQTSIPITTIMNVSNFNYEPGEVNEHGFSFIPELNISMQNCDAFNALQTIKVLSSTYGFTTKISVRSSTGQRIEYIFK